jgi:hypothetical protein
MSFLADLIRNSQQESFIVDENDIVDDDEGVPDFEIKNENENHDEKIQLGRPQPEYL